MTGWFVLEVNILVLGFVAGGLLAAAVVVLPFALGAAVWEARDRASFKRWGPVVGMILALLALLCFPAHGAVAGHAQLSLPTNGLGEAVVFSKEVI
jgi:hypothetical protein